MSCLASANAKFASTSFAASATGAFGKRACDVLLAETHGARSLADISVIFLCVELPFETMS